MRKKEIKLQEEARIIRKRTRIAKTWADGLGVQNRYVRQPHRTAKNNLNCGCRQCHYYKYVGNSKKKFKAQENASRQEFKREKEIYR